MSSSGKVRRTWDVSPSTADILNKLQLIAGVEKSELVDMAINLLFQAVLSVREASGMSTKEIVRSIFSLFPDEMCSTSMEIDSSVMRVDLTKLLSLLSGDDALAATDAVSGSDDVRSDEGAGMGAGGGGDSRCRL